ncbi:hypothetical protein VTH06DRAFT_6342 [Thermothelomyces fergusii]
MNADTRRILSKFDSRDHPDLYQYYGDGQLRIRLTNPSVVITVTLLALSIAYQAIRQQRRLPSLPQLLWDAAVAVIPACILFAVDRFINPPLVPTHMLETQPPTRAAKSEALRRILGIDNGAGIMGSVSQASRRGLGSLSGAALGPKPASNQPPGLGNYDNSCFQNSILQGLAALKTLPAYLSAVSLGQRTESSPTRTVDTLRELIAELADPSSNGKTLWTPRVLKNMNTWQQQDAQEYYSKLLDQIDNEIARATRALKHHAGLETGLSSYDASASQHSDDSGYDSLHGHSKPGPEPRIVRNPLEGLMAQRVACVNCGYCEGLNLIPFNCLTLTLGTLPEHDLYERLDHYTKVEPIEGVECLKCSLLMCRDLIRALTERTGATPEFQRRLESVEEALEEEMFDEETLTKKCGLTPRMRASSTKTKQIVLARPPQSLVFHINRSGFDEQTGYMFKNSAAVRFPMMLDLGPWCLGSTDARASPEEGRADGRDVEQWTLDPRASMVAGDREPSRITGPIYELRAVVTHYGRHENGHYVCYRKHPVVARPTMNREKEAAEPFDDGAWQEKEADDIASDAATRQGDAGPTWDDPPSQWWRLSDEDVFPVDEQTVLSQGGVFMLFYDCVDPNQVLVSDIDKPTETEQAGDGCSISDTVASGRVAIQSPNLVHDEDGSFLEDPDSSVELGDSSTPCETVGSTDSEPEEPGPVAETAGQPQPASATPDGSAAPPSTPWVPTLAEVGDQNVDPPSADPVPQPPDGAASLRPPPPAPEV